MAQLSPNMAVGSLHVSAPLSQISLGYHPTGMIAEQIFPVIRVAKENDLYLIWDKAQAFRVDRTDYLGSKRGDGAQAKELNFGGTYASYVAEEFALRTKITDRERANADSVWNLEVSKVRRTQDLILLEQEGRIANLLTTAGNYGTNNKATLVGAQQWNNATFASQTSSTQSVIKQNLDAGKEGVRQSTGGLEANTLVVPAAVARVMARDVGIMDQIKYTHPDNLVGGYLPPKLWGMNVLMPGAVVNTAVEGEAPTMADVWGKNVVVAYVNPNPTLDSLTAGVIFRSRDWSVKTWRDEAVDTTYYQASIVQAEVGVSFDAAYLISAAIA